MELAVLRWVVEGGSVAAVLTMLVWRLKIHNDREAREDVVMDRLIDAIAQDASAKERLAGALDVVNETIERKLRATTAEAPRHDTGASGADAQGR